jgi:glycine betaine/proline transport system substrate-binding protein
MSQMIVAVDLEGKKLEEVVADWVAKNESRWKPWIGQ